MLKEAEHRRHPRGAGARARRVDATFETLAQGADDARRRPPDPVDGTRLVLDAGILLPPRRAAAFKRAARERARRLATWLHTDAERSWPPYKLWERT